MLSDFDVTIIGLGPVGSFAALLMENRGLKVLAIDRDIDIYSLPDLSNCGRELSKSMKNSSNENYKSLFRVIRYLYETKNLK